MKATGYCKSAVRRRLGARREASAVAACGAILWRTQLAERIRGFKDGSFAPSRKPLLDRLTDQLLVVASDAVTSVATQASPSLSGKAMQRLLAWVVADARGAGRPMEKELAETVGKRLDKQARKVRETLAAASADAAQAREAAREAASQDANLAAALPAQLAAIGAAEREAYARARDEVYIGFHELGSGSTAASASLSVSVEAPPQLPGWVSEEPEEGPAKDELLKRALSRIMDQQILIDKLRDRDEWRETQMRDERRRLQLECREAERCQQILNWELWETEEALSIARDEFPDVSADVHVQIEDRVRDRTADLEYDLYRARTRVLALEAELSLYKPEFNGHMARV